MAAECGCAALVELARGRLQGRRAEGPAQGQDQQDSKPASSMAEQCNAANDRSDEQAADQEREETKECLEAGNGQAALEQEPLREASENTAAECQEWLCELERFREQVHELEGRLRDAENCSDSLGQQLAEERLQSEQQKQDTMELRVKAEVLQEQLERSTAEVSNLARLQREQVDHVLEIRRLKCEADEREIVCQTQAFELERRALAATLAEQGPESQDECSTPGEQDDGVDMAERSEEEIEEGAVSEELSSEGVGSPASPQWEEALAQASARASEFEEGWRQAEARSAEFEEGWRQAEARVSEFEEGWRQAEARAAALEAGAEELESKLGRAQEQAAGAGGARLEALLQRAARAEGRADALAQKVKEMCVADGVPRLPRVPEESPVPTGSSGRSSQAGAGLIQWDAASLKRHDKRLSHGEMRALRQHLAAAETRAATAEARERAARSDLAAAQEAAEDGRRSLQRKLEEEQRQHEKATEAGLLRSARFVCEKGDPADKEHGDLLRQQLVQSQEVVQTWKRIGEQARVGEAPKDEPGQASPPAWLHAVPTGAPEAVPVARGASPTVQRTFLQASPTRSAREPRASAPSPLQASPVQSAREPRASAIVSALLSTPSVVRVTTVRHSTPPKGIVAGSSTR